MAEESGRTRFHHGFYAAMKVEYDLAKDPVSYIKENARTVIDVCLAVNRALAQMLRREGTMGDAMQELINHYCDMAVAEERKKFQAELDRKEVLFKEELGRERQSERQSVAADMLRDNYPLSAITKISKLSEDAVRRIAQKAGIAVVS